MRPRALLVILALVTGGLVAGSSASASASGAAAGCAALLDHDFRGVAGAPARIDAATAGPATCDVKGHTGAVRFELKLPLTGWTQRFLMVGCGGYCGSVNVNATTESTTGCPQVQSGELAVASTDLGHTGGTFAADGLWGLNNPTAIIDFGYAGMHKVTLASKAVIRAYYGQPARYSYFTGCSNGGREALMEAQRYPDDYDGIIAASPTIDDVVENTFEHGWNVRANSHPDGTAILTADKIPALHTAVLKACGYRDGGIGTEVADPRGCHFDARTLVCPAATCLTGAQAAAANRIWSGPVDERGTHLAVGGLPYGSELSWIGGTALQPGQKFGVNTSFEFVYSYDFPNYDARWNGPTGITNQNMRFTADQWRYLTQTSAAIDATDPDLAAFQRHGGKLIIWDGWGDTGSSPFATLNYFDAVTRTLGQKRTDGFVKLYMPTGEGHCGGGTAGADYLSPLIAWREQGAAPGKVVTSYRAPGTDASIVRTQATFPYPAISRYTGSGDPDNQANWRAAPPEHHYPQHYDWIGDFHYTPRFQQWFTPTVTATAHP
ncbi:tannase/feruloyl esterase family alpha/beta hydrolase [Actinoplanes sp. NPDC051411]|uniref:tannase/feruloyl esterase family alpha/beta hydrolase n=1 Tax=Actinoplanes sp. NPDC051411 TaxID=3155522 RepID=UPI003436F917